MKNKIFLVFCVLVFVVLFINFASALELQYGYYGGFSGWNERQLITKNNFLISEGDIYFDINGEDLMRGPQEIRIHPNEPGLIKIDIAVFYESSGKLYPLNIKPENKKEGDYNYYFFNLDKNLINEKVEQGKNYRFKIFFNYTLINFAYSNQEGIYTVYLRNICQGGEM